MMSLATLAAAASAGLAEVMSHFLGLLWARRTKRSYLIWSMAFWSGPLAAALTIGLTSANFGGHAPLPLTLVIRFQQVAGRRSLGLGASMLLLLLAAGCSLKLLRLAIATKRVRAMVHDARVRTTAYGTGCLHRTDVRVPVFLSDTAPVPFLAGLFRPLVLLPASMAANFTRQQISFICEHEFTHAARHDNFHVYMEELAAAFLWWCPATRATRRRLALARETSCDAIVLGRSDLMERRAYALTLLQVLGARLPGVNAYAGVGKAEMGERIAAALQFGEVHATSRKSTVALVALLLTTTVAASAGGRTAYWGGAFMTQPLFDISLSGKGVIERRSGRPLYRIVPYWPSGYAGTRPALPSPMTAPAIVRRQANGTWMISTG